MINLFTRTYLSALLLLPALLAGCVGDDLSDCPTGLKAHIAYEPATYARTGIDPSEVDRIDLFVFDTEGIFRGVWIDEQPKLTPGYFLALPNLPEGNYWFVVWGGLHDCYNTSPTTFVEGQTTFDEALLRFNHLSGEVDANLPPLFHAIKSESIKNTREQNVTLQLVQAYNTINLTTEGFPSNDDVFSMSIYDNNGKFKFDHSFAIDSDFKYTTSCTKDSKKELKATLNVLRMAEGRSPILEIFNTTKQKVFYRVDLSILLSKIGEFDYDSIHTFDIHIYFTTDYSFAVTINGWKVTENETLLY